MRCVSFWHPISGPSTTLFFTQLTLNLNPASQYSVTGFKLRLLYDGAHAPQTVWLISGAATSTAGAVQAWSVDGYNVDGYVPSTNSGYTTYTLNSALTVQYNGVVTIAYQTSTPPTHTHAHKMAPHIGHVWPPRQPRC